MFIICIIEEEYNIQKTICLILSVLVLNLAFPDVSSATEPNLVGWWKFDETSGSAAYDSSGVGTSKSGTLNGGAAFITAGYRNGAVLLDGASGYVSYPADNFGVMVRDELEQCTIAIWVYWDGGDMWQRIIDIGSSQASYFYITPGGSLGLQLALAAGLWDVFGTGAGNPMPANGWHHVAVTVSDADSEMILYLDGEAVASKSGCTNSIDDIGRTSNNWLGRSQYWPSYPDPFFDGIVDDFKIYSRVLTRAEIRRTADPEKASMPEPADEDTIPKTSMILEWQAGIYADKHDVYFGSNVNDVREANTSNPMGVLLSQDQETTSYPVSSLVSGETYYWRIDEVNDACTPDPWKGRIWSFKAQPLKAYEPSPPNDAAGVFRYPTLSWEPGKYAAESYGHELYYGTEFNDVNERVGDPVVLDDPCFVIPSPNVPYELLQVIYWVVDEVNESHPDQIWPGNVWRFTIEDYTVIDDFETYTNTGKDSPPPEDTLKSVWGDGNYSWDIYGGVATSGSLVQLNTDTYDGSPPYLHYQSEDIAQSGTQSMKFYYDNDGTVEWEVYLYGGYPEADYTYTPVPDPYLSEAYAAVDDAAADSGLDSLDMLRDWSIYNVLVLSFYGDPNNTNNHAGLYVGLEDTDGTLVTIAHPDPNLLTEPWWHNWYVKLSDFTDKNGGLDLENIVRIYLGFGDKDSPASGGSGVVFFDDIQLFTGVCIPGTVIGDFDDDCTVNNSDLEIFLYHFPGQTPTLPQPIINLAASGTVGSPVTSWSNTGSEGGTFVDVNSGDPNKPVVEMVAGKKCVTFDATDMLIWNQNAPATITGDSDYTVIYEVYNPTIDAEEWLLTWAQRGGPERSSGGVGYGTNAEWGCIIHWDPPGDMGFDLGVPVAKQWHTIAATYDGTTNAVIVDGLVHGLEDKVLLVYEDQPVTIGAGYEEPADANEAYILNKYVPTFDLRFTGSVASIKVYGEAVPPGDLAILTASLAGLPKAEADVKPDNKIDFGDLAVMGYKWMEDPYLFGEDY